MKTSLIFLFSIASTITTVYTALSKSQIHEMAKASLESRELVTINNSSYFIGSEITLTWSDALEFCNAIGDFSLASFETLDENTAVKDYLNSTALDSKSYWISAKQVETDLWVWIGSGKIVSVFDWAAGEPDELGSPVCVHLNQGAWHDDLCSLQMNFICQ